MPHVIQVAPSGRARCRSCKGLLPKGELRFGEAAAHAFGDGEALHWYHLSCGVERRPEAFLEALGSATDTIPSRDELERLAALGVAHPRWTRVVKAERAPSGRAKCRHCRETIEQGALRLVLEIVEEGRANPVGFVHPSCMRPYAGTIEGLVERVERAGALPEEDREELGVSLEAGPPRVEE